MKILFIVTQSEFGGAQRFVFEAARYFAQQDGNEVIIMSGEGDGALFAQFSIFNGSVALTTSSSLSGSAELTNEVLRAEGLSESKGFQFSNKTKIKTISLKYLKRTPGLINAILSVKEIVGFLKSEKPEVLFLCSTTAGILGSIAASIYKNKKKFRVSSFEFRVVYRIGGWAFRDPRPWWQNKIILWLEKLTARFKDKIIVNSEIDQKLAIKYKICAKEKIVKIYNGVDINQLEFLSKDEAIAYISDREQFSITSYPQRDGQKGKIVGCVANFYKTKGLEYLIEAIHLLSFKFRVSLPNDGRASFETIIIGDGRERKKLEKLIAKYGLEKTVFLVGKIPDAYKYLKAFDIFVLPSLKEGFPWIILEAMAAAVPIVATSVGAVPEIIENEKQGLLVPPKNSRVLAEKIAWLLEHPSEAREMARLAREKAKNQFTREKMLSQTAEIIFGKNER